MYTLCITTSSKNCSTCILQDNNVISKKETDSLNSHSVVLVPLIVEMLENSNLQISDINKLVLDIGPGSFTGIRIGLATLKAISSSLGIPIHGVSSLDGLFSNYLFNSSSVSNAIVVSMIAGKKDEVFYKIFECRKETDEEKEPQIKVLKEDCFSTKENLEKDIEEIQSNPEYINFSLVYQKDNNSILSSENIAKFANLYPELTTKNPNPLYLKKVQAQIELEKKESKI